MDRAGAIYESLHRLACKPANQPYRIDDFLNEELLNGPLRAKSMVDAESERLQVMTWDSE